MDKTQIGPQTLVFPTPVVLVGANVDDKPNFMVAAWCGFVNSDPPTASVSIQQPRHTYKGITRNQTFSINVPSADLAGQTDYCGTISGAKADKVKLCGFDVFYGKLENAPLIEQCPVNLECRVIHMLNLGSHFMFIGRIEEIYVSKDCLTDGKLDFNKSKPFVYAAAPARQYHALGQNLGARGALGKAFETKIR
ncbi:MAG: flavin reductase family protein [Dehalococcoidales bacterium]|nr:flavin reductase family protein [Dehalococcoidales bacterium]